MKSWKLEIISPDGLIEIKLFEDSTWEVLNQARPIKLDELNKLWDTIKIMKEMGYTRLECNLMP